MSYLVLARKWRPQGFEDLIGQQPIVRILTNSIRQGKIAHAYVFSGPRGVGKTSTARILAKSLNCAEYPDGAPCGKCESCRAIAEGHSVDVIEIDGASNNSVDDIRDLREKVKYAPSGGKYKIYIIDESHMLSTSAFNALLKTLEEPPPHVVFILATTEARKIPLTVMSRCQHLPFRRVPAEAIKERLKAVCQAEGIGITEGSLGMLARAADGSIRDALTILDQLASFTSDIKDEDVRGLIDISDFSSLLAAASAVIAGDREGILNVTASLNEIGADLRAFSKDLVKLFRDLLVSKLLKGKGSMSELAEEEARALAALAEETSEEHIVLLLSEVLKAEAAVRGAFSPRVALEMSLLRLSYLSTFKDINEAISAVSNLRGGSALPQESAPANQVRGNSDKAQADPQEHRPDTRPAPEDALAEEPETEEDEPAAETEEPLMEEIIEDSEVLEPFSEEPAAGVAPMDGAGLLQAVVDNIEDMRLSSMLSRAEGELRGDTLALIFTGPDAELCAGSVKEGADIVMRTASGLRGVPTQVEIHIEKAKAARPARRDSLRKKVMAEPLISEALDLFEGRVLNFNEVDEAENN